MFEAKYHKDCRHNYLIIKDNGCLLDHVYQWKMVTENKIKGLLSCHERYINGDILLYYEITSRQSIFSIYESKSINREQLCNFFIQLKMVNDVLQKYLLDGNCIVLCPEYIFQNIETGEYAFLYFPESEEDGFSLLMDFFIARVDNDDLEAVEIVYKIADLVHREQFVLDEILRWFQEDVENGRQAEEAKCQFKSEELQLQSHIYEEEPENEPDLKYDGRKRIYKILLFLGIGLLGIGVLSYVILFYELSYQEQIYLILGSSLTVGLILGSLIWCFYPRLVKESEKDLERDANLQIYCYSDSCDEVEEASPADIGNTVFIPWTEHCENKLYSMDKKNKCHIDLSRLPMTVGKLAGAVDMVIDEASISRMHAKFSRRGNELYITDLNSTNGTFKNGMRLSPNASETIEPGDEIRLGKLKFIYR